MFSSLSFSFFLFLSPSSLSNIYIYSQGNKEIFYSWERYYKRDVKQEIQKKKDHEKEWEETREIYGER